ncbi:MAG: D-aminoacylase [Planctomycetes bacterium]|nr:D-aminoacylase [Planctomycetota bacterium]
MEKRISVWRFVAVLLAAVGCNSRGLAEQPKAPVDADVLLRGGTLHVGDGAPGVKGDVAIVADRIVAVGHFDVGRIGHEIDCRGLVVCPGFIDLHNHSDRQVLKKSTRAVVNYLTQGCTTIVTGNCGSGPVDVGKYYKQMDDFGVGVNVAHLLPQGALRRKVMGQERRKASPDELSQMKKLAEQAMRDGAWGMSTGLIYVPSSYADTAELIEIAKVVSKYDGLYVSHIRNENLELLSAVNEAVEIGREAKLAVHISHFKSSGKNSWGLVRVASELIEKHRRDGQRITADQYPYTASSTSLDATVIPPWARAGGRDKMLKRLNDEKQGKLIRAAIIKKLRETDGGQRLQIASYRPQPSWSGKRIAEIAQDEKIEPLELVLQITRAGGASIVNHSINEEDVRYVMTRPWVATASDGRAYVPSATVPHPRNYGTFPRKIGHYAVREKAISLAAAIRSATGLPADILGMADRGYLRPQSHADVIVLDPEKFLDTATFADPHRYSQGIEHVLVNGQFAIIHGKPTGSLAGRALPRNISD